MTFEELLKVQTDKLIQDIKADLDRPNAIFDIMRAAAATSNLLWGNQTNKWETKDYLTKWSDE